MGVHPGRWLAGGTLFGEASGPPQCSECGVPIPPDQDDPMCQSCRALAFEKAREEKARAEAEQARRDEVVRD